MVGSPCLGSPSTRGSINRLTEERWLVLIKLLLKTRKVLHRQKCRSSLSGWCFKVFEERWRGRVAGTSDHMPRLNLSELTTSLRAGDPSMSYIRRIFNYICHLTRSPLDPPPYGQYLLSSLELSVHCCPPQRQRKEVGVSRAKVKVEASCKLLKQREHGH